MVVMVVDSMAVSARLVVRRSEGVSSRAGAGRASMAARRRGGHVLAENGDAMKAKTSMTVIPRVFEFRITTSIK
jgi:hypothetical protein